MVGCGEKYGRIRRVEGESEFFMKGLRRVLLRGGYSSRDFRG